MPDTTKGSNLEFRTKYKTLHVSKSIVDRESIIPGYCFKGYLNKGRPKHACNSFSGHRKSRYTREILPVSVKEVVTRVKQLPVTVREVVTRMKQLPLTIWEVVSRMKHLPLAVWEVVTRMKQLHVTVWEVVTRVGQLLRRGRNMRATELIRLSFYPRLSYFNAAREQGACTIHG